MGDITVDVKSVADQEMRSGRNEGGKLHVHKVERSRSGNALWPERFGSSPFTDQRA